VGDAARHRGTTPARARVRRGGATALSGLLLGGLIALGGAPADASPTATVPATAAARPTGSRTARISLTSLTPAAPGSGSTLTVTGTVTNRGASTITGAHVGLRIGSGGAPLTSRSAVSAVADRTGLTPSDGTEINGHTAKIPTLRAGAHHTFTLHVPVHALGLHGNGVYQLGITLTGRNRTAAFAQVLGVTRTVLPWYPDPQDTQHTRVALAWPLIDRPHIDARTDRDPQQTPIFRDDALAAELAPGGRLEQMVSLGSHLPVTWVIDPDLLATVDAMAKGYKVAANGQDIDKAQPGTGSEVAKHWINQLTTAVKHQPIVALPFADPDLASIAHHGRTVPGTLQHLRSATDLAGETVQTILHVKPRTDIAWPYGGRIDRSIVGVARADGADTIVADSSDLGSAGLNHTPNAPRPLGGGTTALVADSTLSQAFTGDMSNKDAATHAVQQFLAQTLMITMEAPNTRRSVLVAPQRMPTASQAQAMTEALGEAQDGGWATPVGLDTVEKATPDPGAQHTVPGGYPGRMRRYELGADAFRQTRDTQVSLQKLLVILTQGQRVVTPFGTAVLRSMSTSWRGHPAEAHAYRDSVEGYLNQLEDAVHIVDKSDVTLSGSSGTIQVTVENNLAQEVRNLHLEVTSTQRQRLEVAPGQVVRLAGAHRRSYKFHTSAKANGRTRLVAQLYTANGEPYGAPVRFQVYVTSVTKTVLIVIACGMLLLVLAGIRMYRQRKRAALLAGNANAPGNAGKETADGTGDEDGDPHRDDPHEGDPQPDISAENTEPTVADEKVDR
jgi:Family of unknown function (DUF6049)